MKLRLQIAKQASIDIDEHTLLSFGRDESADICIKDPQVSKVHGEFMVVQGKLTIRDLGSRNGTAVNGVRINDETVLNVGDKIHLGSSLIFALKDGSVPENQSSSRLKPVDVNALAVSYADQTVAKAAEPQELTLRKSADLQKAQPPNPAFVPETEKKKPTLLIAVACVVALLVIAALLMPSKNAKPPEEVYGLRQYQRDIDRAVNTFMAKDYSTLQNNLKPAIQKFSQNHAAHIITNLAQVWANKGEQYQHLQWHRAEELCRELIDAHPSTPKVQKLGQNLLQWIKKEEPNMAGLQEALRAYETKATERSIDLIAELPEDSRFREVYAGNIETIQKDFALQMDEQLQRQVEAQQWNAALGTIRTYLKSPLAPTDLKERENTYRGHILSKSHARQAQELFDRKKFQAALREIEQVPQDSPYFAEVQNLQQQAQEAHKRQERNRLYHRGDAQAALTYNAQHFPEDTAFQDKLQKILVLMNKGQALQLSSTPERAVPVYQEIMLLEPLQHNHFHMEAQKVVSQWTSSDQLAELYLQRGKEAERLNKLSEARDHYIKANDLDPNVAAEELKAFEKLANLHYNRAMSYAIKKDHGNVKAYLKKALDLVPKNSKLYDRIESYARRHMGELR